MDLRGGDRLCFWEYRTNKKMDKIIVKRSEKIFEDIKHVDDNGKEFWFAREMQAILEYEDWRNFLKVMGKAKISCGNSGIVINDHFVEANKMVQLGSGSEREIKDIKLTRYACYLIAQNGDPTAL